MTGLSEPINLTWRQELAAWWSIFWPCWILSILPAAIFFRVTGRSMPSVLLSTTKILFYVGQPILLFRLVRKNYRSFWIGILREGEPANQKLTLRDSIRIWRQLLVLQVAFYVGLLLLAVWLTSIGQPETSRRLNVFETLFGIFIVGPAAIRWAMLGNYKGFRLQAYRRKRKIDPNGDLKASEASEHRKDPR